MATYGDKTEPGIITNLDSALSVSTAGASPSDVGIVGQADLTNGSADPNTAYEVTRATEARNLFGAETESLLTAAILDAFREGAFPVYAVATEEAAVSDEDLAGISSTSGALANAPVSEDPADTVFTIDGNEYDTTVVYDDPSTYSPSSGTAVLNPVTGDYELASVPSDSDDTNDSVDYVEFDYVAAHEAMKAEAGADVDFFVPLSENPDVVDDAQTTVDEMAAEYNFAILLAAPGIDVDPTSYTNEKDDSRTQFVYPTRFEDTRSALGAYAGKKAALGLDRTPINTRLETQDRLLVSLSREERGMLIDERVVPIADESPAPRIVDDPTTVTSSNEEESGMRYGFSRLVMDYIITVTRENEAPFIGRLNTAATRNTFADLVAGELDELRSSNTVTSYTVNVERVSADTASLEVFVEVPDPVRFIENDFLIGSGA